MCAVATRLVEYATSLTLTVEGATVGTLYTFSPEG
jgi:hypothetical protein